MQKLTKVEALERVQNIKSISNDPESAHYEEDQLLWDFLFFIANDMYEKSEATEIANIIKSLVELK